MALLLYPSPAALLALAVGGALLASGPAGAAPTVSLDVDAAVQRAGDTHVLRVTATVPEAVSADVYFVARLPSGEHLSLVGTGLIGGLHPYLAAFPIPAGFSVTGLELLRLVLPALPPGTYTWLGGLTVPGTLNLLSNLAERTWTYTDVPAPTGPAWLTEVNFWRRSARLPELTEDPALSAGDVLHATYVVKTDDFAHAEDAASPFFTEAGHLAAQQSNGAASTDPDTPDTFAVESWLQAPFHSVGLLDPRLRTTGYGSFREAADSGGTPDFRMSGWLDVLSDRAAAPSYPVVWPGDGQTIPIPTEDLCPTGRACFWGESPSPLTSCPGYVAPAGLPLVLQLGSGEAIQASDDPSVIGPSSLVHDGSPLEHCLVSELDYANPVPADQDTGRTILGGRDAVVLIPREPLAAGRYDVSLTVKGASHAWSFTIDPGLQPAEPRARPAWADGVRPPSFRVRGGSAPR